ncbi:MAG: alpha-amylase family glycosyl hydrolase [Clostridia bacterium]|nr:alpha-amylase family glycosyl hydrolase [Clostridia bacterium]
MKTNLKKSVIYQIYLRTFTSEGTLNAATRLIPHLSELGIDIIYLSALNTEDDSFENQSPRQIASGMNNPKNPYRIKDYFSVDEEFGTMEDLKEFVKTAHMYGLKVLIDLVYLHCSKDAVFIKENPDFVVRDENNNIKIGETWPFARLNYDNPKLREYLWGNMKFYVKDIGADGFRCDAGDLIPYDFWSEGIKRIKKINPDIIMLNEGQNPEFLDVFDINYNFNFMNTVHAAFANKINSGKDDKKISLASLRGKYTAANIKDEIINYHQNVPKGRFFLANSENHDTVSDMEDERLEIFLGSDGIEAIFALLFTLDCVPMIYNGCEVADNGLKCMFWNRFCPGSMSVQWQNVLTPKGKHRLELIKELIRLHRYNQALSDGSLSWISHDCPDSVLAFKREIDNQSVTIVINISAKIQNVTLDQNIGDSIILSKNVSSSENKLTMLPYGFSITQ